MKRLVVVLIMLLGLSYDLAARGIDWDKDGWDDAAIFRESNGLWAVRGVTRFYFGGPGDLPVPGDYNGDDDTDAAIFRPSTGLWAIRGAYRIYFGGADDAPLFDGGSGLWRKNGNNIITPETR